ncbi:phospholipase C [Paenibacillus brasilensis]|uniref:Phospholipase C n=2 Tax=Paenibacillus brasilensis TaxID=128574 RepID=A0ABU0KVD4_9BACL|nr:alkaline phosphatase family protein [Paenibacillus brasilensis]MDQ0493401.1 phospholipase C [Paenibacillus brasilensis]
MKTLITSITLSVAFCMLSHAGKFIVRSDAMAAQALTRADSSVKVKASQPNAIESPQRIDHIVIVVEENHSSKKISGNPSAPFMNDLMKNGVNLMNHYAIEHPSQPNYLDLFSGSNQGVHNDLTPKKMNTSNLALELIQHGYTFGGYSEGLPRTGFTGPYDLETLYARKHNPWVNFNNLPASINMPLTRFPQNFNQLPTVSFVIPNLQHDMHDGTIREADQWLQAHLSSYARWAPQHNSLLIVTWDEDDMSSNNKIPTMIIGAHLKKGLYNEKSNHFSMLRMIEQFYGLNLLGKSRTAPPLNLWTTGS